MKLSATDFEHNQSIPAEFTCQGEGVSPGLKISDVPKETKSLTLIMHDPDAPMGGGFTHWVIYNLDPSLTEITENTEPAGSPGLNGADKTGYIGPCPPTGEHRYIFQLYALDTQLDIKNASKDSLEKAMTNHILDQTELIGLYQKSN